MQFYHITLLALYDYGTFQMWKSEDRIEASLNLRTSKDSYKSMFFQASLMVLYKITAKCNDMLRNKLFLISHGSYKMLLNELVYLWVISFFWFERTNVHQKVTINCLYYIVRKEGRVRCSCAEHAKNHIQ